ncbi:MAG: hypothetical protein E7640_00240 [Ruminococcaceae bacterium]|nr:hypothetical protein [Oscillospiraceae bacterium]
MNFLLGLITQEGYDNIFSPVEGYFDVFIAFFIGAVTAAYIIAFCVAVAAYILQSIGLMRMLKKVGYARPWHAWVPFFSQKATGELADMYNNGKAPSGYGRKLLRETVAVVALFFATTILYALIFILTAFGALSGIVEALSLLLTVADIALSVVTIVYMVHMFMALWCIYKIFSPENATVFLVLSILISLAQAIIIFIVGKKEPQNLRGDPSDFGTIFENSDYKYDTDDE